MKKSIRNKVPSKKAFKEHLPSSGLKLKYERLVSEGGPRKIKGIVDKVVLNDDIEITREHGKYRIRRINWNASQIFVQPEVSNAISIPDSFVNERLANVILENNRS